MYDCTKPVSIINNTKKTYLIGAMENPSRDDAGEGWRNVITPKLNKMGIYCFDPTKSETQKVGMSTKEILKKLSGWQLSGHWQKFTETMNKIWRGISYMEEDSVTHEQRMVHIMGDVNYIEQSNFLIFHYTQGDILGGTIAELAIAWYLNIPVYLITDAPRITINKSILYFVLDSGKGRGSIIHNQSELLKLLKETE